MNEIETKFYQDIFRISMEGFKRNLEECSYVCKDVILEESKHVIGFEIKFNYYEDQVITGFVDIVPQFKIDRYYVDFMIGGYIGDIYSSLVVEIDGHEWHEKTKDQVAKDKKRERNLLLTPYSCPIMRFTGSEIFNSKKKTYYDVFDYLVLNSVSQKKQQIENINEDPNSAFYKERELYYASR